MCEIASTCWNEIGSRYKYNRKGSVDNNEGIPNYPSVEPYSYSFSTENIKTRAFDFTYGSSENKIISIMVALKRHPYECYK